MIAIIYNASIKDLFYKYAVALKSEFDKLKVTSTIFTNQDIYNMQGLYNFKVAVFLDKDIILGKILENSGIKLFNSIDAIKICDDKRLTYLSLSNKYNCPKTIFSPIFFNYNEDLINEFILSIEQTFEYPFIAKLAYGSLGNEVFLISDKNELDFFVKKNYNKPVMFSEFIKESSGRDVRVYVVGSNVIASMLRNNPNDFRSNIALSGTGSDYPINEETKAMCINIAKDLKLDFCGIDLLFKNGNPSVICEVNSNAMFAGINKACNVKIEESITKYIVNSI